MQSPAVTTLYELKIENGESKIYLMEASLIFQLFIQMCCPCGFTNDINSFYFNITDSGLV
jgi:hypothetical protein